MIATRNIWDNIHNEKIKGVCGLYLYRRVFRWRYVVFLVVLIITLLVGTQKRFLILGNQLRKVTLNAALNSFEINTTHLPTNDHNVIQESTINTNVSKSTSSIKDKFPFKYLINEPEFCYSNENLYIINIIATAPWDVMARSHIRRSWGNKMWLNMTGFRTVFLLGEMPDLQLMDDVREESNKHRDIIQFSFLDTYDNLTLKTLSGLHWINTFCPTPAWVLKSDTDVLVNIFELSSFLHKYDEVNHERRNYLLCKKRSPASPCRKFCKKKWQVSLAEYPYNKYPVYCMGPGYIIPRRLVAPLYQTANKTHPYRIEDVYYTGIIPAQLGWTKVRENIAHRFPWRPTAWQKSFVTTDLMILELDTSIGQGASTLVWTNILQHRGLSPTVDKGRSANKEIDEILSI